MAPTIAEKSVRYEEARADLAASAESLKARFEAGEDVVKLVHARTGVIDSVLVGLWRDHVTAPGAALIAVGGYGRGELHPYSDIDVMLLLPDNVSREDEEGLATFVTALWDIGLEIGHSVRTVEQCLEQATADLTVATRLMAARL